MIHRMIHRIPGFLRTLVRNRRGQLGLPRFLTYTVTFGCNAKCIMCDSWKMSAKGDLSITEVERIFQQLPPLDAIRLTGGEPFARRDLVEIARLATVHLRPLMMHVTTNGFLTDRIVDFCEHRPKKVPLDLLISIDGVEEKHNQIRGHSQAYEMCMNTIRALAERRGELNMRIAVNQTIVDEEGVEHYRLLREVLRPFGIRNHVVMAYDVSATYHLDREIDVAPTEVGEFTTFGEFSPEKMRQLLDDIDRDLGTLPLTQRIAKRYYNRGIRNRLLGEGTAINPKCVALNSHLRLFPNGDVPTCQFNSQTIGNFRENSFEEIWNSTKAAEQKAWVKKCPGCWAECEVLPSAIYTGDLLTAWS